MAYEISERQKKRDALVSELLKLERELKAVDHQLDHGTYWHKEQVWRDCNRRDRIKGKIDEINKELNN